MKYLYISTFSKILLSELNIINQRFIDITAIDIKFSKYTEYIGSQQQIQNNLQFVQLNQIKFTNNILLKTAISHKIPMVSIQSDAVISIFLKGLTFICNFVNYYLKTQTEMGNFLFVDAELGNVTVKQLYLQQNFISNSSSSMLHINSYYLEINGIIAKNLNILDLEQYQQFLPEIKVEIFEEDFLITLFPQYSDPGIWVISGTIIQITDCLFEDIQSYSTSIFSIIGKNNLQIELKNFTITNISSSLDQKSSIYGCFLINAQKSNFNLYLHDMEVMNVFNKMEAAFLTVIPSDTENQIILDDLSFINVLSLKNSIFSMGKSLSKMNKIQINNITLKVSEQAYYSFFQQIQTLELVEKDLLGTQNAFIFIQSSQVRLSNLLAQGYFSIPIIQIVKSSEIKLENVQFHNIHTLQSLILIQSISVQIKYLIVFQLVIQRVIQDQTKKYNSSILQCPQRKAYQYKTQTQCQIQYDFSTAQQIYDSNSLINLKQCDSQILTNLDYSLDGLIMIDIQQIQQLSISNVKMNHKICKYCSLGLLVIKLQQIIYMVGIDTLQCFNNNMNNYGCIYIQGVKSNSSKYAEISKAKFISNKCNYGCALTINTQPVSLTKSKIIKNIALRNGGGINEISEKYDIIQSNVIYLDNQAKFGGAMYIKSNILNITQLNQVYYSNNRNVQIYDQPIKLNFMISTTFFPSSEVSENTLVISKPKYLELQSNNYFMVPSGQFFYDYKVFNSQTRIAQQLNITLHFEAQNQFFEIITDLQDSICSIQLRDYDLDLNQPLYEFINFSSLIFDQITLSYRLDQLLFSINPYNPSNIVKQALFECSSIYNNNYRYLLNLRSYFCQIGEQYVYDECQLCKSEKGQYSVKANQTKCQQVDYQKIKNNTETDIELLPGYWRPSYGSELIEICIRKQINCKGGWIPGKDSCINGHLGALCEECDISSINGENHFYKSSNLSCVNCKLTYEPIITMIILSLWTILSIFLTTKSMDQAFNQFYNFQRQSKYYIVLYKYSQNMASCLIKIAVNQLLVISSIITNSINFNIDISFLFYVSSPTLTNSYNLDCFLTDFTDQTGIVYFRQIVNLIIPFLYINTYFLAYFTFVLYEKIAYSIKDLYTPMIYIFVLTQPDIIKYCGSLLANREISGLKWIQADVSLLYWTDNHIKWTFYATLPILFIWSVFVPVIFYYELWKNKNNLRKKDFRKKWCYMYDEYTEESYYWEILKIIQRQLQILVLTIFYDDIILKSSLLIFIQSIYLLIIIKQQPFNTKQLNILEIRCVSLCIYILIITLILYNAQVNNQIILIYISQIFLLCLISANILPIIFQILLCYFYKYLDDLIIFLRKFSEQFPIFKICFESIVRKGSRRISRKSIIRQRYNLLKSHLLKQSKQILEIKNGISKKNHMRSSPSMANLQVQTINQGQQILQFNQLTSGNVQ